MPLTAFSTSRPGEFDVDQILKKLAAETGQTYVSIDKIPDGWREHLKSDLQCPACFITGAEVVRGSVVSKSGKPSRQSYFRFTVPGHRTGCEFDSPETANVVPENLVPLGESRSSLTRAVRDLVCTGIALGVFSQTSIRDMREWFFNTKVASLFVVTLDPRTFAWMSAMQENASRSHGALPEGVEITPEIAALTNFDWRAEAAKVVRNRYPQHEVNMRAVLDSGIRMFGDPGKRCESLVKRYSGRAVFDPTVLVDEYQKTLRLAEFIAHNHPPLESTKGSTGSVSVLAFSALLLFVSGWDMPAAIAAFAKISPAVGTANPELGNVMGLNPFHDYQAWSTLKQLQDFAFEVPDDIDIKAQRVAAESALRAKFGIPPQE